MDTYFISIIIFCFFITIPVIYVIIPFTVTLFLRRRFKSLLRSSNCVYLTFDDGPDPDTTPKIVSLLDEFGVKATFFVLGENVEKFPETAKLISDMGHEIGHHGFWHTFAWKSGPFKTLSDISRGIRVTEKYCLPQKTRLYRPPYGKLNIFSLISIIFKRLNIVFWTVDPKDYNQSSGETVAQLVVENLPNGSVVLLHDGRRNKDSDSQVTVEGLKYILEYAKKNNIKLSTVGELFNS